MPWTVEDPPAVAKHWSAAEVDACVTAANAVLAGGGDDEQAIFACIHAAGKGRAMGWLDRLRAWWSGDKGGAERSLAMLAVYELVDEALAAAPDFADGYPWLNDLYVEDGQIVALVTAGARLYRVPVMVSGEDVMLGGLQEVAMDFRPVRGRLQIVRQADGAYRWFAIAETSALLRVGEIDSRALFDSFVAHAETSGYPVLRFYHQQGLDFGHADWLARDDNCLLASGLLDGEHPLAQAYIDAAQAGRGNWGTSVGFDPLSDPEEWAVADGVTIPVYTSGVCREISVLPEERAASWFTTISLEVRRMRTEVREALASLFGDEEKAAAFIATVDDTNREIQERGLVTREDDVADTTEDTTEETTEEAREQAAAQEPEAEPEPEETPVVEGPVEVTLDDDTLRAIADRVTIPEPDLGPVHQRLAELGALVQTMAKRIDALERSDDDKRRQWQADLPARRGINVTYRPREAAASGDASMADRAAATLANLP